MQAALTTTEAHAAARYASPSGSGVTCSAEAPCEVKTAIEGASSGDDVYVPGNLGDYVLGGSIKALAPGIRVHGTSGRPRLIAAASSVLSLIGSSSAEDLYLEGTGTTFSLHGGDSANDVIVKATDTGHACYFGGGASMIDSVCWAGSTGDLAVETDGTNTFRNDTFAGGTEAAVKAFGRGGLAGSDTLVNVIARSGPTGHDLEADASDNTADATISAAFSNYETTTLTGTEGRDHVNGDGTDQTATPVFVNAIGGDFHEAAGSPTIDAGINDPANGSTDFDGGARVDASGHTDIGADEFYPGPSTPAPAELRPTRTQVACNYFVASFSDMCIATVSDIGAAPPVAPTGVLSFTPSTPGGLFVGIASCGLVKSETPGGLPSCSVEYLPPAVGSPTMTANYGGDGSHRISAGTTSFPLVAAAGLGGGLLVSQLAISPSTLIAAQSGPPASSARAKAGALVIYTLRAPARVTFTVQQPAAGRLARTGRGRGARTTCAAPNAANRHKHACTRWLTLQGSYAVTAGKGRSSFRFRGRIGGRTLRRGRYRLLATPSVGGVTGRATSKSFQVKRGR